MNNSQHLVFYTILLISSIFAGIEGCLVKLNPALVRDGSNTTLIGLNFYDTLNDLISDCRIFVDINEPDLDAIGNNALAYSEITDLSVENNYRGLNLTEDSLRGLTQLQTLQINTPIQSSNYTRLFEAIPQLKHLALSIHGNTQLISQPLSVLKELKTFFIFEYRNWTIDSQTFANASQSINQLSIFGNEIEVIHENSFSSMRKLKVLIFENNGLNKIKPGAFNNLNLTTLHFSGNGINEFERGTFSGLSVGNLDFSWNNNITIRNGAFENSTIGSLRFDPNVFESVDDATRSAWGLSESTEILISTSLWNYQSSSSFFPSSLNF